ncbi:MAG: hypothetical protein GY754_01080 [bacterium]|nr:hypothetical protein [bacterium]
MSNISEIVGKYNKDKSNLLDIIRDVQSVLGCVTDDSIAQIASELGTSTVDVEGVVTFYHFFSKTPVGKYAVYLNNSPVAEMKGRADVVKAFEAEVGCSFGSVSANDIGLFDTSCIGMNDQEPAALINGVVFTNLDAGKVKSIVADMKAGKSAQDMVTSPGDGQNANDLVKAMVQNNIKQEGKVIFSSYEAGAGLAAAKAKSADDVIEEVKASSIRGRGGAGFPAGMKWGFCKSAPGDEKYVICNADEGEPGTFKDRVILTERPQMVFEGMAIAGYAMGAKNGILYLRAEYEYLLAYLNKTISDMDLGDFNLTIKLGGGAYICGEESALIESAEGKRGEPRNRPPFPAQKGYMGKPSNVNNVETYASVPKILTEGADWYKAIGTVQSSGTKLLSVSGDCDKPGVYEVDFGLSVQEFLDMAGAKDVQAVQVGGPSGTCIGPKDFGRKIAFEDLATGGSMIVIGKNTDLLGVVHNFMEFFVEESCGWCVPCRAGNVILTDTLEKVIKGKGTETDLKNLADWSNIVKAMSRCGLGQTSPNPIATTLENFKEVYDAKIVKGEEFVTEFDMAASVAASCEVVGRKPNIEE